jgi:argininosuccinate lyase
MANLWGGRFVGSTDELVERLNNSLSFDQRLWTYDIQGSIAHATMLGESGIIPLKDAATIVAGLNVVAEGLAKGNLSMNTAQEDVHSAVEALLGEKIGPVAGKLHTARSRNDQVATDTRLYVRDSIEQADKLLNSFQQTLVQLAERELGSESTNDPTTQRPNDPTTHRPSTSTITSTSTTHPHTHTPTHPYTILPGFTHLQHAQPVLLSHHLLAYFWMFHRDRERLADCRKRVNQLPLGAGALAGTTFPINRERVANLLGFEGICENSLDAVSDRDYAIEFLSAASILMVHCSRLAEEIILWNSPEFGYVELDDSVTTGSSIMPQKKNPDAAELARGKTGRVFGHLMGLLTVVKGLPLSYNKDMQEDKEPLFDTVDTLLVLLPAFEKTLATATFNRERMAAALWRDFSTATDLADLLVTKGMPFRDAHKVVGSIVRSCIDRNIGLEDLQAGDLTSFSPLFGPEDSVAATIVASVEARRSRGGTAPAAVREQLERAKQMLSAES